MTTPEAMTFWVSFELPCKTEECFVFFRNFALIATAVAGLAMTPGAARA